MLIYLFIFINTIDSLQCSQEEDIISFLQKKESQEDQAAF